MYLVVDSRLLQQTVGKKSNFNFVDTLEEQKKIKAETSYRFKKRGDTERPYE